MMNKQWLTGLKGFPYEKKHKGRITAAGPSLIYTGFPIKLG